MLSPQQETSCPFPNSNESTFSWVFLWRNFTWVKSYNIYSFLIFSHILHPEHSLLSLLPLLLFLLLFYLFILICIYVCVCAHGCMCIYVCTQMLRWNDNDRYLRQSLSIYFWDWVSLNLEMTHLAWLTSQQAPGISAQVLMLIQQVLYQLSHFPSFSIYVLLCLTSSPNIMVLSFIHAMNHYLYIF